VGVGVSTSSRSVERRAGKLTSFTVTVLALRYSTYVTTSFKI
jgi:hypothetical protein